MLLRGRGPFGRMRFGAAGSPAAGLVHGDPYTITGSGFGTKATAAPVFYDDFTAGTADATITGESGIVGTALWKEYDDPTPATFYGYKASEGRRGGKQCFKKAAADGNDFRAPYLDGFGALKLYCTYWLKVSVETPGGVWKYFRVTANGGETPYEYAGCPNLLGSAQLASSWVYGLIDPSTTADDHTQVTLGGSAIGTPGAWVRIEGFLDLGSGVGVADGAYFLGDVGGGSMSGSGVVTRATPTDAATRINSMMLGVEIANDGTNPWTFWVDEVYVDTTQARVELGDAASWAACTQREIQRPTAWDDSSVTFVANCGTFTTGQTRYLYVVKGDGTVVSGGSVVVG